jgi:ubiquinol-cytochrome c reductase cytochrome b subunit
MKRFTKLFMVPATFLLIFALAAPVVASNTARGKELVASLGCTGCHVVDGKGGTMGPELNGVGKRMDDNMIKQKLVNPKASNPKSIMPSYGHLPPADLEAVKEYLEYLK